MKILKNYSLSIIFIIELVLLTMTSTWTNEVFNISISFLRFFTVLQYSPLIIIILVKIVNDIKRKKITTIDKFYYVFLIYYVLLTTYRLFAQMEIKESFYYTLVLLGTWSFWIECKENCKISTDYLSKNLIIVNISIVLYCWIYFLLLHNFIAHQPININLTSISILLFLPFILYIYHDKRINSALSLFILSTNISTLFLSGSRIIFSLTLVLLLIFIFHDLKKRRGILVISISIIISIVVTISLYMLNISNTRYSVDRELTVLNSLLNRNSVVSNSDIVIDEAMENTFDDTTAIIGNESSSEEETAISNQVQNSDNMRVYLWEYGIKQVKDNFFFGTGDVEIEYKINENYTFNQSPHNFILESLICYGFIGTTLLFVFAYFVIYGNLHKIMRRMNNCIIYYVIILIVFYTTSLVEPFVYNLFSMTVFIMISVYFTLKLENLAGDEKYE